MAKLVQYYQTADGNTFESLEEAEAHEKVGSLVDELAKFNGAEGFNAEAAAKALMENYNLEPKGV